MRGCTAGEQGKRGLENTAAVDAEFVVIRHFSAFLPGINLWPHLTPRFRARGKRRGPGWTRESACGRMRRFTRVGADETGLFTKRRDEGYRSSCICAGAGSTDCGRRAGQKAL